MALPAVARGLLSRRPPAKERAPFRQSDDAHHRDQRFLLLAAKTIELPILVPGNARGLRLRGERRALSHAQQEAPRLQRAAREFSRLWSTRAGRETRADLVATSATAPVRRAAARGFLRDP